MSAQFDFTRRSFLLAAGAAPLLRGQTLLRREWTAKWIAVPKAPKTEYGVYHFRKTFDLASRPERFLVHTSGDNRYQLFVNGQRAAWGPARGDLFHWRYETVDIAGFCDPGRTCSRRWCGTSESMRRKRRSPSKPASYCRAIARPNASPTPARRGNASAMRPTRRW